jgi:hypothetical protein
MACMVTTLTLVKDKDFGIKLESATPVVDQPDGGVDRREVDKVTLVNFTIMTLVHSCHAVLFCSAYTRQTALQEKRTHKG